MNPVFLIVAIIYTTYVLLKEKFQKPLCPKGSRFDYEARQRDIENGMDIMERIKKQQRGEYYTLEPKKDKPNSK